MNFPSVLEKKYEHSRFAHFYTNSFGLIRESYALFRESHAFIRESYAFIREKYNFFLYENEPNRLSYRGVPTAFQNSIYDVSILRHSQDCS